jgi:hypothetical protein
VDIVDYYMELMEVKEYKPLQFLSKLAPWLLKKTHNSKLDHLEWVDIVDIGKGESNVTVVILHENCSLEQPFESFANKLASELAKDNILARIVIIPQVCTNVTILSSPKIVSKLSDETARLWQQIGIGIESKMIFISDSSNLLLTKSSWMAAVEFSRKSIDPMEAIYYKVLAENTLGFLDIGTPEICSPRAILFRFLHSESKPFIFALFLIIMAGILWNYPTIVWILVSLSSISLTSTLADFWAKPYIVSIGSTSIEIPCVVAVMLVILTSFHCLFFLWIALRSRKRDKENREKFLDINEYLKFIAIFMCLVASIQWIYLYSTSQEYLYDPSELKSIEKLQNRFEMTLLERNIGYAQVIEERTSMDWFFKQYSLPDFCYPSIEINSPIEISDDMLDLHNMNTFTTILNRIKLLILETN